MSRRRLAVAVGLAVMVALAGCAFDQSGDAVAACEGSTVAFHGDGVAVTEDGQQLTYGYEVPAGAEVFVVATLNGSVVGIERVTTTDSGVAADNVTVDLEREYAGEQPAALAMYADVDGDGEFDSGGVDEPCQRDGDPVATGTVVLEFPGNESQ